MKIFRKGRPRGAAPHSVNSGPPHISESIRARKLKFYTRIDSPNTLFGYENFSARDRARGAAAISVNLGPLISRKLIELES